ncbi:B-cell receptor CD22-like [Lampris incognitus]|uniref:B-cell receptor CD22-like n=1 Tax=Lampris incognitus TaxID=2546036 RepID=UPI0024B58FF2|nr:B-cell receptor CD22-like [Lampris incognitus]
MGPWPGIVWLKISPSWHHIFLFISSPSYVCAVEGSTVDITCSYEHSGYLHGNETSFWFTRAEGDDPVDLVEDSQYTGRVEYHCEWLRHCTLKIKDLRKSDSANYKFRFTTNEGKFTGSPGVNLTVTELQVEISPDATVTAGGRVMLTCITSCRLTDNPTLIWHQNRRVLAESESQQNQLVLDPVGSHHAGAYSCSVKNHPDLSSPEKILTVRYAPEVPAVSVSPSDEIKENSSVTLNCSSAANPPIQKYTWFKENRNPYILKSQGKYFVFDSIKSSDSGIYFCTVSNELGEKTSDSILINVKCILLQTMGYDGFCLVQVFLGTGAFMNVPTFATATLLEGVGNMQKLNNCTNAPKLPSVSVIPTGEIEEGSSVTLSCSSDANPPVEKYTWFKEKESSPVASGQNYTINDIRTDHSGNYYCEVRNERGGNNSTSQLIVVAGEICLCN